MKKLAFAAVVAFAFVACQKKEETTPAVDSTTVTPAAVDTSKKDTTKVAVDTTKKIDSAKKVAVDSVKKADAKKK